MNSVILCIDDEEIILTSLKNQLTQAFGDKLEIELAQSGDDALQIIEELKEEGIEVALIISDYLMPNMNGDEFLIKSSILSPNTKNILLTGQANMQGITRVINEASLYRYIQKPWEKEDLILTVTEALQSKKNEDQLSMYTNRLEQLVEEKTSENQTYLEIIDKYLIASKTDTQGIITDVSEAMCDITGYSKEELVGQNHNIIRHPDMPVETFEELWNTITQGKLWEGQIKNRKKNGDVYWVTSRVSPTFDNIGNIIGYASIRVDITDKIKVEKLSITDELTKLHNRRYFNTIVDKEFSRAKRENKHLAFVIFDVDYFKLYNDTYGHLKGDDVLKSIAQVLQENLHRASDYGFRLGGEEFGILVYDINEEQLITLVEKIKDALYALNIVHEKNSACKYVSASFGGIVFNPSDKITLEEIYQKADALLYEVKNSGRNRIIIKNYQDLSE